MVEGLSNPPRKKTQLLHDLSSVSLSVRQRGPTQQAFKHMATLSTDGPQLWTQTDWLASYLPHAAAGMPPGCALLELACCLHACMRWNSDIHATSTASRPQPQEEAEQVPAQHSSCQAINAGQAQEIHMYDVSRPAASSDT